VVDLSASTSLGSAKRLKPDAMNQILISQAKCWKCENCSINNRAICRAAPKKAIEELNRISHIKNITKGQTIIAQGESSEIVGNVVSGIVKVLSSFEDGRQQIVGLMFPSDFFGRVFDTQSKFSYEAATDVTVCTMARLDFENLLTRYPEIEHELLVAILDELDAMREWLALIHCRTTMQRVATFLQILANRDGNHDCRDPEVHGNLHISLPISRRDIATYLGTTPETLSRNIQSLSRQKIIRLVNARQFEIIDPARLTKFAGSTLNEVQLNADWASALP
jgi:CRP/FNR family transcriptional regulator